MNNATMMMNALPRLLAKRVPLRAVARPLYLSTVTMEEENDETLDYFDTLGIEVRVGQTEWGAFLLLLFPCIFSHTILYNTALLSLGYSNAQESVQETHEEVASRLASKPK